MDIITENSDTSFELSQSASERIKILLKDEKNSYFRISVLGGGCSGFQYDFSFTETPGNDDYVFKSKGIDYVIDKVSMNFLKESKLEYVSELSGSYFKIENPNATANCGCGTSFSI